MKTVRHPLVSPSLGTQRELVSLHYGEAGLLYARVHQRYATRDMAIAKVAGAVAFRTGNLLSP